MVGPNSLNAEQMKGLGRALLLQLQQCNQRALERTERRRDQDYDDELEEEIEVRRWGVAQRSGGTVKVLCVECFDTLTGHASPSSHTRVTQNEDLTDELILKELSELMHTLFKHHGPNLLPMWEGLAGAWAQLLDPERPEGDRQWALCVFDDFIEYCGPAAWEYSSYFLPQMLTALHDSEPV